MPRQKTVTPPWIRALWLAGAALLVALLGASCSSNSSDVGPFEEGSGGSGGGSADDSTQSWQKTTDEVRFAHVSVGGGEKLELRKMRVTVRSEGLRTRTLVDHIFFNPFDRALEGTFRYPLPAEAGVSYFAMFPGTTAPDPAFFGPADPLLGLPPAELAAVEGDAVVEGADPSVWGAGQVARVVKAADATRAYEKEAKAQVDPALVEEVAPNSFKARVFPIPASGYIRVVVAYEQTLPRFGADLGYAFPLAKDAIESFDFTLTAPSAAVSAASYVGDVDGVTPADDAGGFTFTRSFLSATPGGNLEFRLTPTGGSAEAEVLTGTDAAAQQSYFYVRVHPALANLPAAEGGRHQAVFLVDTSLSEHPDQFNVNRKLIQGILESTPEIQRFAVITFDVAARWLTSGFVTNDAAGRAAELAKLDALLLEGATDFSAALHVLATPTFALGTDKEIDAFVLSDGLVDWGDTGVEALVQRYASSSPFDTRFFAYRTGIAADNLALFQALTRRGAIFNCFNQASIPTCSTAHRATGVTLQSITVEGVGANGAAASNLLVAGRQATLFTGAELTLAGHLDKPGPAVVHLVGKTRGSSVDVTVPVTLTPSGTLAPRAWAEIAVTQILDTHDPALEGVAMALSQRYRLGSRLGSFLILASDAQYTAYDFEDESAKFSGQSIPSLVDASFTKLGSAWTTWNRLQSVINDYDDVCRLSTVDGGKLVSTIVGLTHPSKLELPTSTLPIAAVAAASVPASYAAGLTHDPDVVKLYVDEAERRRAAGDVGGAVRAISTLVENDPSNAEIERLIGYRVASWQQPAEASALFLHTLERRPFEPQSYRDLANALGYDRPGLSALLFEAVLAGDYDAKFGLFKQVVNEEYALFIEGLAKASPSDALNPYLAKRKSALGLTIPKGDLRVVMTWNTNDTDIDLWVTDPDGEKCYYANPTIASGGVLLDDETQGYGPERFQAIHAISGDYKVQVHYYGNHSNQLIAETYVNVAVMTHLGTSAEKIERFNVVLRNVNDVDTVKIVHFD
jgi:hypothetical protein